MDLSIVLPVLNEERNLASLLRFIKSMLPKMGISYEVIVVDGGSKDNTVKQARESGLNTTVIIQDKGGYGEATRLGLNAARGDFIVTLDSDLSHNPKLISSLWNAREGSDMVIASRYISGGSVDMPAWRLFLSRALNAVLPALLSLPVRDLSSGFRLYRASAVKTMSLISENFEILEEILIKGYAEGWKISEVPMHFRPRKSGKSKVRLLAFALSFLKTFVRMWKLRNSIACADYDDRAYDSRIPLQRYWQRRRYQIIIGMTPNSGRILDIGCGSSRILSALPKTSIGLDILFTKLRYARKFDLPLVNASIFSLPFIDQAFDTIICSEVIEHIPAGDTPSAEMKRILKPGGRLVIGTPDYGGGTWPIIEAIYERVAPGGYAHEHITHYTQQSLADLLQRFGFSIEKVDTICKAEMIFQCTLRKIS